MVLAAAGFTTKNTEDTKATTMDSFVSVVVRRDAIRKRKTALESTRSIEHEVPLRPL